MNKGLSKDRLKRVKWASDDLLCQVKLFLSEDCPSEIGSDAEDHLQIKASLHCNGMNVDDLPPGFGGKGHSYTPNQICISPQIRWNRPPMFKLDGEWHVVAGEESEERNTQNCREMRVLEALYPRISAIPPSPSVSPELEACRYDDSQTPIIPLNPIEDEDTPPIESTSCSSSADGAVCNVPTESKPLVNEKLHGIVAGLDADIIAAASAAYTASLKGNEMGSMVDTDLLIRILNEPKLVEALTKASAPLSFTDHQLSVSKNTNNISQQKPCPVSETLFTSQPFQPPTTSHPNARPFTVTSTERANDNLRPFSTSSISYSASELPNQFISPSTVNPHAILSQLGDRLRQGQENGYMIRDDRTNAGKSAGKASSSTLFGSNASSSDMFIRPRNLDLHPSQSSLDTGKTFSQKPENVYPSHGPNVISTVRPENHSLTMGSHASMGASQYLSPQPDRFTLPTTIRPAPAKDLDYYKSLIRLHGSGAEETSQEQFTLQYQVSLPEVTPVSGQVHARPKSQKPCKFFNSPKGCRYGLTCPFEHAALLDLRTGNYPDTDRSKRLKMSSSSSSDLQDKC